MDILLTALIVIIVSAVLATIIDTRSKHQGYHDTLDQPEIKSPIARILDMGPQCAQAVGVYKTHQDREKLRKDMRNSSQP